MKINKAEKISLKKQYSCPAECTLKQDDPSSCKICKSWLRTQKTNYARMTRFFHNELVKSARNFQPYDYGFLISLLHIALSYMEAYYSLGYNVFSSEEERSHIEDSLNKVLNLLEAGFNDELSEQCFETVSKYLERYNANEADYQMPSESTTDFVERANKIHQQHVDAIKQAFVEIGNEITSWVD